MIIENRAPSLARSFALSRYNHRAVIITLNLASSFKNGSQICWRFGVGNWSIFLFSRIIINVIIPGLLKNRATKICQSLALIGDFNGPCYLKGKISPQKEIIEYISFHLIGSSVLKVTKVKFSLIWKIRHFKGAIFSVGVTDCKAISPVHPIFHWSWSPKNNLRQHCPTKPSPTTTSLTACCLGTLSTEWVIACMQTETNCTRVQKHIKLSTTPPPWNLTRLPQMRPRW